MSDGSVAILFADILDKICLHGKRSVDRHADIIWLQNVREFPGLFFNTGTAYW